jgi:hypothetical protein
MSRFQNAAELHRVFDRLFDLLSKDPDVGPRLRAKDTPQRYVFTDLGTTLDVWPADAKRAKTGHSLQWVWDKKKLPREPDLVLEMTSDLANRYFQGKENVALALATKKILVVSGDSKKALDLLPIVLPFHTKWVERMKSDGLAHLLV